jgi:hypothetical protein
VTLVVSPLSPSSLNESSCVDDVIDTSDPSGVSGGVGFLLKLNALANLPKKKFERLELSFDIILTVALWASVTEGHGGEVTYSLGCGRGLVHLHQM